MKTIDEVRAALETKKDRSAWDKGVTLYALELLETIKKKREYYNLGSQLHPLEIEAETLNGARNWKEYSYGERALIYDGDIAERLCSPSELRNTRNGERNPNNRENWLDCQARALSQAFTRLKMAIKEG